MPWCPKCKNEYRDGIAVCADCGCELVEEEELARQEETASQNEFAYYDKIHERYSDLSEEEEQKDTPSNSSSQNYSPYRRNAEKAEDNKSSAWTLLIVGSIGLLAMILGIAGIIPLSIGNPYMFYGVMSAVFLLFIVMGIVSMKNARLFAKKAESENTLIETLEKWCREQLSAEQIDSELAVEGEINNVSEEILYFRRYEKIKERLNHQFMNLDQDLLEHLIDEKIYDMVFGK